MHAKWRRHLFTANDFEILVKDGQKADLIDGIIHMASPDSLEANDLFMFLATLFRLFVSQHRLGRVFGSRAAFRLDEYSCPEPDIAFVRSGRLRTARGGRFNGAPDLALEIVSPDSV